MKISDLIVKLNAIAQEHGDLPVLHDVQKLNAIVFRFPDIQVHSWLGSMPHDFYLGEDVDLEDGDKFVWL